MMFKFNSRLVRLAAIFLQKTMRSSDLLIRQSVRVFDLRSANFVVVPLYGPMRHREIVADQRERSSNFVSPQFCERGQESAFLFDSNQNKATN
jgi:hypothetical protein